MTKVADGKRLPLSPSCRHLHEVNYVLDLILFVGYAQTLSGRKFLTVPFIWIAKVVECTEDCGCVLCVFQIEIGKDVDIAIPSCCHKRTLQDADSSPYLLHKCAGGPIADLKKCVQSVAVHKPANRSCSPSCISLCLESAKGDLTNSLPISNTSCCPLQLLRGNGAF
jgi:hypothetical protein